MESNQHAKPDAFDNKYAGKVAFDDSHRSTQPIAQHVNLAHGDTVEGKESELYPDPKYCTFAFCVSKWNCTAVDLLVAFVLCGGYPGANSHGVFEPKPNSNGSRFSLDDPDDLRESIAIVEFEPVCLAVAHVSPRVRQKPNGVEFVRAYRDTIHFAASVQYRIAEPELDIFDDANKDDVAEQEFLNASQPQPESIGVIDGITVTVDNQEHIDHIH